MWRRNPLSIRIFFIDYFEGFRVLPCALRTVRGNVSTRMIFCPTHLLNTTVAAVFIQMSLRFRPIFAISRSCVGRSRAVESESEGILGGVGVGKNYRLRLRPQSKILTRYSKPRALIATVTIRLLLKYRL
jgi:hypothetical protein